MLTHDTWVCPAWIRSALAVLCPPSKSTVSLWADEKRILSSKTSSMPGRWRTDYTPYLRGVMDAFTDPEVEEIAFVKCTQVGGTETILNMLGYVIDQDPGPTMVVYPRETDGESASENRIQVMINACPSMRDKFDSNSKRLDLQFEDMHLVVSGANSPASLASHPIRFLFMDEVDKYPVSSGKEADPRSLARERTKTFESSKKIVCVSTPTFENGAIWQDWEKADTQYRYFVECPHCKAMWTFKFAHLKFDNTSKETAEQTAVYVCEECGGVIDDRHKMNMIRGGQWQAVRDGGRRRVAYHLNVFYSPWVRFGEIAYEFVSSYKTPSLLMNFINSWLGEPYKEVEKTLTGEWIHTNRQSQYPEYVVRAGTAMLTGGVDVQKNMMYWTIRAWLPNMTSYNLCHGRAYSWHEIEYIMNQNFYDRNKNGYIVNLCAVDSGDQTDDVYDFCAINSQWAVPVKGASSQLQGRYRRSTIDRVGSRANGQALYLVDTNHYKDTLFARIQRDEEDGGWFIYEGCDPEYCEMIASEHKVIKKYNGRLSSVWEVKAVGRDNHYLDCEVYAMLAADLCGIRTINAKRVQQQRPEIVQQVHSPTPPKQNTFINKGGNWFK